MARALALTEFDFILESDLEAPEEERTTWRLRPLTFAEHAAIGRTELRQGKDETDTVVIHDNLGTAGKAVQAGLVGWKNFKDAEGAQIEFTRDSKTGKIPDRLMDEIKPFVVELSDEIFKRSTLTRTQAKNSISR